MNKKKKYELIKVLIIVAIISVIIFSLVIQNLHTSTGRYGRKMKTVTLIDNLDFVLDNYWENIDPQGFYPEASAEQNGMGTANLIEKLRDTFMFSDKQLSETTPYQLVDGWGNPMRYKPWFNKPENEKLNAHNKNSYDLWSAGEDGDFETEEDNITNWKVKTAEEN